LFRLSGWILPSGTFCKCIAAAGYNFDSLMIPFRCVASDVQENSPVILRKGDLGSAIRASMTFPFTSNRSVWMAGCCSTEACTTIFG
jgi:predicted acylesterase/phospholipase RssA